MSENYELQTKMLRFVGKRRHFSPTTRERTDWELTDGIRTKKQNGNEGDHGISRKWSSAYNELEDAMNKRLKFGTAGLRGQMGPGYGKMNELTVLQATDGLCTYLVDTFGEDAARERGIVIGYDHRAKGSLSSERFASLASKLAASRGFRVHAYSDLLPLRSCRTVSWSKQSLVSWLQLRTIRDRTTDTRCIGRTVHRLFHRSRYCGKNRSSDNWDTRHSSWVSSVCLMMRGKSIEDRFRVSQNHS